MDERFDTLPCGARLFRDAGEFKLTTDCLLLLDFIRGAPRRVCDLGAGAGILALLLALRRADTQADGVELQPEAAELFNMNVAANGLESRARVYVRDLRDCADFLRAGAYDLVVSNPPYFPASSRTSGDRLRAAARSERGCSLRELCAAAGYLLKNGGRFALVYRAERLSELFCELTRAGIEPKRLRLAARDPESAPVLALVEGRRQGKPGLCLEPCVYLSAQYKLKGESE